jgi:hypothetical protein
MMPSGVNAANETDAYAFIGSQTSADGTTYGYVTDTDADTPTTLTMECYDTPGGFNLVDEITLTADMKTSDGYYVVPLTTTAQVFRVRAEYASADDTADATTVYSYFSDNGLPFRYGDVIPYTWKVGYGGKIYIDLAHDGKEMNIGGTLYHKGFGIHATGYIYFTVDAGLYNRFVTACGVQKGQPGIVNYTLTFDSDVQDTRSDITQNNGFTWDYPIPASTTAVKVDIDMGTNNGNDHSNLGGTRFYLSKAALRQAQAIAWSTDVDVHAFRATTEALNATASSGLPVHYRIVAGADKATISDDGTSIAFNATTTATDVVVEAYQPGNDAWAMAPIATCTYHVTNSYVVLPTETLKLADGTTVDQLTVYNNGTQCGQVVTDGLVQVGTLIYKQTFTPGESTLIAFPVDMDIAKVSDITTQGYTLNGGNNVKSYTIKEYANSYRATGVKPDADIIVDPADRTVSEDELEKPDANDDPLNDVYWLTLNSSQVSGKKGYMLTFNDPTSTDPFEVTFTLKNVSLDLKNGFADMNMSFDLSNCASGSINSVYISPKNVAGNTLKVDIYFHPESQSELPMNYSEALRNARVTYTPDNKGIRLTLPNDTPAKVAIYNATGSRMVKAVRYTAPFLIDVSDLDAGTYQLYISYGNAYGARTFTIPSKR